MPKKSDKPREPTQIVALQIRIREDLRSQIEAAASASGNSMNSEIAERLSTSLREDAVLGSGATRRMVSRIAGDIAMIEGRTGKSWIEDLATFEAVRRMIEATVARHKPPRENFNEVVALIQQEEADQKREDKLTSELSKRGVIQWRQPNALAALADPSVPSVPYYAEAHPDEWHPANGAEERLSREEIETIGLLLQEWRSLRARYSDRLEKLKALREPVERAEQEGAAIYKALSGELHDKAIAELEARSGA